LDLFVDLRQLIENVDRSGRLIRFRKRVDPRFELAAIMRQTGGNTPLLFENVKGSQTHIVCGISGSREDIALGTRVGEPAKLPDCLLRAIKEPIPVCKVSNAPVQENVVYSPFDISDYIPALTYSERDSGSYLVSGVMIHRDEGKLYTSVRRMQLIGENKTTICVSTDKLSATLSEHERRRQPLAIAVMFGVIPAVMLSSQISTRAFDVNKLDVAGALLATALPVTRGITVDLPVLANAEIVLEGHIYPWRKASEGPFGELCRYYGAKSEKPIVEFSAITYRSGAIFQTLLPAGPEEKLIMAINREAMLKSTLCKSMPSVKQVHVTLGGQGRYHAVIQISKKHPGDGKQTALASFAADRDLKHVVVVDDDVDIFDPLQVEWAIATRMQADKDIFIVPSASGSLLDPSSSPNNISAKMGIDATCPPGDDRFEITRIPCEDNINWRDYL
jgi:UbiD family decarboxylase